MLANLRIATIAAVLGISVLGGGALLLVRAVPEDKFVEYRMGEPQDAPINGRIEIFPLPRDNARPFSVAVDRDGNVW